MACESSRWSWEESSWAGGLPESSTSSKQGKHPDRQNHQRTENIPHYIIHSKFISLSVLQARILALQYFCVSKKKLIQSYF